MAEIETEKVNQCYCYIITTRINVAFLSHFSDINTSAVTMQRNHHGAVLREWRHGDRQPSAVQGGGGRLVRATLAMFYSSTHQMFRSLTYCVYLKPPQQRKPKRNQSLQRPKQKHLKPHLRPRLKPHRPRHLQHRRRPSPPNKVR